MEETPVKRPNKRIWILVIAIAGAAVLFGTVFAAVSAFRRSGGRRTFPVSVNEILTSNGSYANEDGVCCDYIELYNCSDTTVSIGGCQLWDDGDGRYTFPQNAAIDPHGYAVVWCSRENAGLYYADFGLTKGGGETIRFLTPEGKEIETVTTLSAGRDVAQGIDAAGNWTLLPFASPGRANTEAPDRTGQTPQTATRSETAVRINEIMAANAIYPVADGACTDWIELYNAGDAPADLSGFALTDDPPRRSFVFPEGTVLGAGEYRIVPCDKSVPGAAPFGLTKSGGEIAALLFPDGTVADAVRTEATGRNRSMARQENGEWTVTRDVTPGYPNTPQGRADYIAASGIGGTTVHITELMADNKSILADAKGRFYDWIELTNTGEQPCTLSGWYLSDDADDPAQWQIPDCTFEPGQSRVIFLAKNLDGVIEGQICAPMSLSAAGETVYLVSPIGEVFESVAFDAADEDRSLVIDPVTGAQTVCDEPTPGYPNTAEGYERFCETLTPRGAIAIWEVMTANDRYLPQSGEYFDWVELKNISSETVNLSSYSISDDSKRPDRFVLPDVTLKPGALYTVILSGHTEYSDKKNAHAGFALNAVEDSLFLFENGTLLDCVHLYRIPYRESLGRMEDRGGFFYMSPTPGKKNQKGYRTVSAEPVASLASGVYRSTDGVDVALTADGTIYYTTDCTSPDRKAKQYTGPIHLNRTTVIRAIAYEPEQRQSRVVTFSYLLNTEHTLPVVSLVTDPKRLWDPKNGIYVDSIHRKNIEVRASIAYFGDDGTWTKDCGIKMHGATSLRDQAKKTFAVKFSGVYGGPLHYDVFGDGRVKTFRSVLLRADAEGNGASFIRDNLMHRIAKRCSPTMPAQNSRYVVLYLNGKYWGIYAIREQYSTFFYASNMGVPEDTVTVAQSFTGGKNGLAAVLRYAESHDLGDPAHYAYVSERIDTSSFIDWAIFEAYCGNFDTSGNMRFLYSTEDGKWRCGLVDLDLGFFRTDAFVYPFRADQVGPLLKQLLKNDSFREQLLLRLRELLSTYLSDDAVAAMIDELAAQIRSEIPREKKRWEKPPSWESKVTGLKDYVHGRAEAMIRSIKAELGLSDSEVQRYFGDL